GQAAEPGDVLQLVAAVLLRDQPATLELRQDAGDVLAAPPGERRQVRMRHDRRQLHAVLRQLIERGRHELQEPLRHSALEVEEQERIPTRAWNRKWISWASSPWWKMYVPRR